MSQRNAGKALAGIVVALGLACGNSPSGAPPQSASWLAEAQSHIEVREYRASENATGLQAPNRRQNLRTYFEPTGILVHDRLRGERLLALRLTHVGRGEARSAVAPGRVVAEGARVEIHREGLVEWYENRPEGLEQGFDLETAWPGEGPLVLALALDGGRSDVAGEALVFTAGSGRRLDYGKLAAWDATGRTLTARFRAPTATQIEIEVDDRAAQYPITIDPLLSATADTQLEGNQAGALLGASVATAGDVNGDGYADVIVGAPRYDSGEIDEGAAFVFLGSPVGIANAGSLSAQAQIEGNQVSAFLGGSVATAGDVNGDGYADVIVGARNYNSGESSEGAAFVFLGSPAGIADGNPATAHAQLESNQTLAKLGVSVATAGDVNGDGYADVIVGAEQYDSGEVNEGAAFVFLGSPAGIADGNPATAHAQLESNLALTNLGTSVATAGDVNGDGYADVIVGAPNFVGNADDGGVAFVFLGSPAGIADGNPGTAHAQFVSNQIEAQLGASVATAGDVNGDGYADVIVGAPRYDSGGPNNEGAAFVFLGGPAGIADGNPATAHAQIESNQTNADLGSSVATAGDVNGDGYADVIVGAPGYDSGEIDEGAAFVFLGGPTGIADGNPATADTQLESNQGSALLGDSVATAGDVNGDGFADVIVGAEIYDAGENDEGVAFVFLGGADMSDGDPTSANTRLESNQDNAGLGASVASDDFNGDGYADVLVGAPDYDAGQVDEGAAFVFLGGPGGVSDGIPVSADTQLESDQAGSNFGVAVASAGDVNGDGYADVIIGASAYDENETNEGAAFLFHGSSAGIPDGSPLTADATLQSNQVGGLFGVSVASAGDVNGDGYVDVLVGALGYDNPEINEGAAFVFLGGSGGVVGEAPSSAHAQLESDQAFAQLGRSVASAGDVNGDGYADVIVGAQLYDAGENNEGASFVFLGSPAGIADGNPATAATQLESNQVDALLGGSVATAGDVNGDGFADVIVGATNFDAGENNEGAAFVFLGGAGGVVSGIPPSAHATIQGDQVSALLGYSVASAGDVNADGYADVIVGARFYDVFLGSTNEGVASLFLGSATGIADGNPFTADAVFFGLAAGARMGSSLAAGDVDGDGFSDVIVGAEGFDAGQTGEGGAFVFLANGGIGRPVLARQQATWGSPNDGNQPWAAVGGDGFDVSLIATHPEGRGRVKLEVEWCPQGVSFGHVTCDSQQSPTWTDVTATSGGVPLSQTITGLPGGELIRWRACVLHARFGVDQPGIIASPNPAHGPWRRPTAQAREADIRPVPEPGVWLGLLSGVGGLIVVGRSRQKGVRRQPDPQ